MADLVKIVTDNEWDGKYELLEQEYLADAIPLISLGDNLPTGPYGRSGATSHFKRTLKHLSLLDESVLRLPFREQLSRVHQYDPDAFCDNYNDATGIIARNAAFIARSRLPHILALVGNREFDYQAALDFFADLGIGHADYRGALAGCGKFKLVERPEARLRGSTGLLLLPFSPSQEYLPLESALDGLRDLRAERNVIFAHENPWPQGVGMDRRVHNQRALDLAIAATAAIKASPIFFCGHLDASSQAYSYLGAQVQPISGTEKAVLNVMNGTYQVSPVGAP